MALRQGDTHYLSTVPDINPISTDDFIRQTQYKPSNQLASQNLTPPTIPAKKPNISQSYGEVASPKGRLVVKSRSVRGKKQKDLTYSEQDLRAGAAKAGEKRIPGDDALRRGRHIASADEYMDHTETTA